MKIQITDIKNNQTDSQNEELLKLVEQLDSRLAEILISEIKLKNKIFDVAGGWPKPDSIFVQLRYKFKKKYIAVDVNFEPMYDPHKWGDEYSTNSPVHLLVCPII